MDRMDSGIILGCWQLAHQRGNRGFRALTITALGPRAQSPPRRRVGLSSWRCWRISRRPSRSQVAFTQPYKSGQGIGLPGEGLMMTIARVILNHD